MSHFSRNWRRWSIVVLVLEAIILSWGLLVLATPSTQAAPNTPEAVECQPDPMYPQYPNCVVVTGVLFGTHNWVSNTIYVVDQVRVPVTTTINIAAGTIIKLYVPPVITPSVTGRGSLIISGTVNIENVPGQPAVFTSYRDDFYGGDTNNDDASTDPALSDYYEIRLANSSGTIANAVVRWGHYGLRFYNSLTTTVAPVATRMLFERNTFGLIYDTANSGSISGTVTDSIFNGNLFGLGSRTTGTGAARPILEGNTFQNHNETQMSNIITPSFPIYLDGTAYPTYINNIFAGSNRHQAIALGGAFNQSGTWEAVTGTLSNNQLGQMPYVVYGDIFSPPGTYGNPGTLGDFRIAPSATVTVPQSTVFKFYVDPAILRYMYVFGTLRLQSTAANNRVIFTSYRDDEHAEDTNGDGAGTSPNLDDWHNVTLTNSTTLFDYAAVRYGRLGLRVYNPLTYTIFPTVTNSVFQYNTYGMFFQVKSTGDITSTVQNNVFDGNRYGIGTQTENTNGLYSTGSSRPVISNNNFINQLKFPIYLGGNAYPVYSGNTFANNNTPGIGLGGYYFGNGTWELVEGGPQITTTMPYVITGVAAIGGVSNLAVLGGVQVGPTSCGAPAGACGFYTTVTVLPTTAFKAETAKYFEVEAFGNLNLTSTADWNRVIFTSIKDDTVIGDTNGDGPASLPARGNWDSVIYSAGLFGFLPAQKVFDYALVRYSINGVKVDYNGPANNNFSPELAYSEFAQNTYGNYLYIDNLGDINSAIHHNLYLSNTHGLYTKIDEGGAPAPAATGVVRPYVHHNTFQGQGVFPIFLDGTAFPLSDNPTTPNLLDNNLFLSNTIPAVGLGGWFNCPSGCGNWPIVLNNGNTTLQLPYVITRDVSIGPNATVGALAGTIFKANVTGCAATRCELRVYGELKALGTASSPIIFTSFRDDTAGGDTNRDGAATTPTRTDWFGVTLYSSGLQLPVGSYAFNRTVVKYAQWGVQVYANSSINIFPQIASNLFVENGVGLRLYNNSTGDVRSPITNNVFINNNVAVRVERSATATGKTLSTFTNNDFYLPPVPLTRTNAVSVTSAGSVVTATNNFWDSASGPYHFTLNPLGAGVMVTNYPTTNTVILSPWSTISFTQGISYSILGRVAQVGDTPAFPLPLPGVRMILNTGEISATTTQNGDYNFEGLSTGVTYTVRPILSGYSFSPTQRVVFIAGADASNIDFIAQATGAVSPTITVAPNPLATVQTVGTQRAYALNLSNLGQVGSTLVWTITEGAHTLWLQPELAQHVSANCTTPSDAPWLSVSPLNGSLGGGQQTTVNVTINTTGLTVGGDYTATICVASNDATNPVVEVPVTLSISAYGVSVAPAATSQAGLPGTPLTYTVFVTNTGTASDTYTVTVAGAAFPTSAPANVGPLAAGASTTFEVYVTIPATATAGSASTAYVTLTSDGDPTQQATAALTAVTLGVGRGLLLSPASAAQTGGRGQPVTYTMRLTNTGSANDTFTVTLANHTFPTTAPGTVGPLVPGANVMFNVVVTVPTGAVAGATSAVRVTARSWGDPGLTALSYLTTTAATERGLLLTPASAAQTGVAGHTVTYTLRVTNTGNAPDTFMVTLSGHAFGTSTAANIGPLNAGASTTFNVIVTIPANAPTGLTDTVTVNLTSQNDVSKQANAQLTTTAQGALRAVGLAPVTANQSGAVGQIITYTLWLTNAGNASDSFTVTLGSHAFTTTATVSSVGPFAAGASTIFSVVVTIPNTASVGLADTVIVTVASMGDPAQQATATLTTTAIAAVRDLSLSPTSASQTGGQGQVMVYALTVTNTGNASDSFTIALAGQTFTTTAPASVGPLAAGASTTFNVVVTIPTTATPGLSNTVTVTVSSLGDPNQQRTAMLTTTAIVAVRGVALSPLSASQTGTPNQVLTYTLRLTNTGNAVDTFTVTVSGNDFNVVAPTSMGPLAAGASATFNVVVTIPGGTVAGTSDSFNVVVRSQGDPAQSRTAVLTTQVSAVAGLNVSATPLAQNGYVGRVVTYTFYVTNTGNVTDTFTLSLLVPPTFVTNLPASVGPVAPGASAVVYVTVQIPSNAPDGQTSAAAVVVTSQNTPAATITTTVTTTARWFNIYGALIKR